MKIDQDLQGAATKAVAWRIEINDHLSVECLAEEASDHGGRSERICACVKERARRLRGEQQCNSGEEKFR
jgi:hypothetical protein